MAVVVGRMAADIVAVVVAAADAAAAVAMTICWGSSDTVPFRAALRLRKNPA